MTVSHTAAGQICFTHCRLLHAKQGFKSVTSGFKRQLHQLKLQTSGCKSGSHRLLLVTKRRSISLEWHQAPESKLQVWLLKTNHHLEMHVQHKKTISIPMITSHNTRRCCYNTRRAGFFPYERSIPKPGLACMS